MIKISRKILLIIVAIISASLPIVILAASASIESFIAATTNVPKNPDIVGIVIGFYDFALTAVGGLAMGAIIYGAILYAISSGNSGKQSEAKEWITQALLGMALLLSAYLFLGTINKNIINPIIAVPPTTESQLSRPTTNTAITTSNTVNYVVPAPPSSCSTQTCINAYNSCIANLTSEAKSNWPGTDAAAVSGANNYIVNGASNCATQALSAQPAAAKASAATIAACDKTYGSTAYCENPNGYGSLNAHDHEVCSQGYLTYCANLTQ